MVDIHAFERKSCVCLAAQRRCIHRLRSLGIEQERSATKAAGAAGKKIKRKKPTSFSPCLCLCLCQRQRCQGAMPRLMPSRAQAARVGGVISSLHALACHGQAGRPAKPPPSGLFSVNGGSFWSPRPARQKASPPSSYSIPSRTVPAVRGRPNRGRQLLALFSAKNILRTKRRCLIAY